MSASEETIVTDEQMAHQCRADLLRLIEASVQPGPRHSAADRWAAYLEASRGTQVSPQERVLWVDEQGPVCELAGALAAVCVTLLRSGVSMTAGTPAGILAARAWRELRPLIADADPDLVADPTPPRS